MILTKEKFVRHPSPAPSHHHSDGSRHSKQPAHRSPSGDGRGHRHREQPTACGTVEGEFFAGAEDITFNGKSEFKKHSNSPVGGYGFGTDAPMTSPPESYYYPSDPQAPKPPCTIISPTPFDTFTHFYDSASVQSS
ncbi:hypothetical protein BDP27DRAFT_1453989 [Rhodocollybia butyracea]|uniref:Uncharacterized protein n=1 Tax=Rhodocollybia butyracea TaxID=206335 RepID=A0A9P5P846_9AGAR|nr:hypothetical protein BDP27DRAFT_1453989 [Rhodocollybia butyracea]